MAFDQRGYKAVARACDQVTLPVPWYGAIFDIKAVLGFTGFSLRGLDKVAGEWDLVALAYTRGPLSDRYRIPNLAEAAALQGGMS